MNLNDTWVGARAFCRPGWLVMLLLAAGCAPGKGSVTGTVTYQGKPLTTGTIIFFDAAKGAPSTAINPDGTYSLPKVAAGKAKIAIMMPMDIPFKPLGAPPGAGKTPEPDKVPVLPPKYADPEQSGLVCEVKAGSNTHDVKLD
jgi:hypothetical protein